MRSMVEGANRRAPAAGIRPLHRVPRSPSPAYAGKDQRRAGCGMVFGTSTVTSATSMKIAIR